MAQQSPPFALQNASHGAALFRQALTSFLWNAGPLDSVSYVVTQQSTPNMSVQAAGGQAWVHGTSVSNVSGQNFSTQGNYYALNDAPVTLTIATADPTNPRIDLVYLQINDQFYSGALNTAVLGVVTGTPAGTPATPSTPSNALALATVRVNANATSVTNSNITAVNTGSAGSQATVVGTPIVCTSATRPTGVRPGQPIYETDTGLVRVRSTAGTWLQVSPSVQPDAGWTNVGAMGNSWTNFGSNNPPARYRKLANGQVEVQGLITGGTVSTTVALFTLPAGYRPALSAGGFLTFAAVSNDLIGDMRVDGTGKVYLYAGGNPGWWSLNGITFLAEQ